MGVVVVPEKSALSLTLPATRNRVALVFDQKASGTDGGDATSGSWETRDLNQVSDPDAIGVTVSANRFTLPAGRYYLCGRAPARAVNNHRAKFYSITGTADVKLGQTAVALASAAVQSDATVFAIVNIAVATTFELRHQVQTTASAIGHGNANGFTSTVEIYSEVEIFEL